MKNTMKANNKIPEILFIIMPAFLTLIVILVLFAVKGYAPFGNNSLAYNDASIQYLDFHSYYKDLLSGKSSLGYSFSKTLGGNMIAVFTYYLTSPISLLVLLFSKDKFHLFFDIAVIIKLMLASTTCNIFIRKRFAEKINADYKSFMIALLSLGYGLCQYNISECSNIMWLDGSYMLPFILLAIYSLVWKNEFWKLSVAVGLSIIFNWYTGAINCLFSVFWLLAEIMLFVFEQPKGKKIKSAVISILKYALSMLMGVFIGSVVLLPTMWALGSGNRGDLDWWLFNNRLFLSHLYTIAKNYYYGVESGQYDGPALYVGGLAAIGCVSAFFSAKISAAKKAVIAFILLIASLIYIANPLYVIFSLLKNVTSYWFRYGYIGCLAIVFIAAAFFVTTDDSFNLKTLLFSGLFLVVIMLLPHELNLQTEENKKLFLTILAMVVMTVIFAGVMYSHIKQSRLLHSILLILLMVSCMVDLGYNFSIFMDKMHASDVSYFSDYVKGSVAQIDEIKKNDEGYYRIAQTNHRGQSADGLTACYNDALAYGYWSISGYTSSPDDVERSFLHKIGYRQSGENMCVTNSSILPADSLMGAKYIVSAILQKGLVKCDIATYNNKDVYSNPYALPMGFVYSGDERELDVSDPFRYQNSIYSKLLGEDVQLYKEVPYEITSGGNIEDGSPMKIRLDVANASDPVYGNIPWYNDLNADILVDGKKITPYAQWLSPSVFYIPNENNTAELEVAARSSYDIAYDYIQFYELDLEKLEEVTKRLSAGTVEQLSMKDGEVHVHTVASGDDKKLYLSIPEDRGWNIRLNGEEIHPGTVADCFYSIDLVDGDNDIEMVYKAGNVSLGIVLFLLGIIGTVAIEIINKTRARK